MACTDLFMTWKDGDENANPTGDPYVGGQPLMYTKNGLTVLKNTVPGDSEKAFAGLSRNDQDVDLKLGKCTYFPRGSKVKVWNNGSGTPFDVTATYFVGAELGIDINGLLTTPVPAGGIAIGIVTKAPASVTDTMELVIK